jgi:hypothetical protein
MGMTTDSGTAAAVQLILSSRFNSGTWSCRGKPGLRYQLRNSSVPPGCLSLHTCGEEPVVQTGLTSAMQRATLSCSICCSQFNDCGAAWENRGACMYKQCRCSLHCWQGMHVFVMLQAWCLQFAVCGAATPVLSTQRLAGDGIIFWCGWVSRGSGSVQLR